MSFFLTTSQVRKRQKTVTRRDGWYFLKPGDIVNACVKCQGLKKGEKVEKICQIQILNTREEPINHITPEDVTREGFPEWTTEQFIQMYCRFNKKNFNDMTNRIEFRYLVSVDQSFMFPNICPFCGASKIYRVGGIKEDSDGTFIVSGVDGECMAEPDIKNNKEWDKWWDLHKYDKYSKLLPLSLEIEAKLNSRYRFILN